MREIMLWLTPVRRASSKIVRFRRFLSTRRRAPKGALLGSVRRGFQFWMDFAINNLFPSALCKGTHLDGFEPETRNVRTSTHRKVGFVFYGERQLLSR